jgi:hypothetical protein
MAPDPSTLIQVGDTAAQLAKELVETTREVELKIENFTSDLTMEIGSRYGGSDSYCLSSAVDIGPKHQEGLVFTKPKGSWVGCWGYQTFRLVSTSVNLGKALLVVFYSVPAAGSNAFYIGIRTEGKLHFDHKTAMDFYSESHYSTVGTISIDDYHGYTIKANMSDSYNGVLTVWVTNK